MNLHFTQDWFSHNIPVWQEIIPKMAKRDKFLEVGAFEGRATCWLMQNALSDTGTIRCVDTWQGSPEHTDIDMDQVYLRFLKNTARTKKPNQELITGKTTSTAYLGKLLAAEEKFDLIYIDGHHSAPYVMTDCSMAYWLLEPGGILIMDDYLWKIHELPASQRPKEALDAFLSAFSEMVVLVSVGYQLIVQKRA